MQGHEPLLAMRRAGQAPAVVFIDVDLPTLVPMPLDLQWQEVTPLLASIEIGADETVARLDLRCVIGLTVHVSGVLHRRVSTVRDACIAAKAKRVIASFMVVDAKARDGYSIDHITDTEGHMTHG
jgi:hypothetical protein